MSALTAQRVTAQYGRRSAPVFADVSITVPQGRLIGLIGPSGSGKSTLARVLTGLLPAQSGTVMVSGAPIVARRGKMTGEVGMLFQSPRRASSPRMTIRELITEPLTMSRNRRAGSRPQEVDIDALLASVGLTSDLLPRRTAEVSDGQLQRACLARSLVAAPTYLICDEATTMLDPVTTASITRLIRREVDAWARGLGDQPRPGTVAGVGRRRGCVGRPVQLVAAWSAKRVSVAGVDRV